MFIIDPREYAPAWLDKWAKLVNPDYTAVAIIRMYDVDSERYPRLRDRTLEVKRMLHGLTDTTPHKIKTAVLTGSGIYNRFDDPNNPAIRGAAFTAKFKILVG